MKKRVSGMICFFLALLLVCRMSGAACGLLIIDPGHGGEDGGAQSADGLLESDVNLAVGLRMEALGRFCGLDTVMTRRSPEIAYPSELDTTAKRKLYDQKQRLALINSFEDAVLISVHQNKYPDPRPRGPQVLYGSGEASKRLGELSHQMLTAALYPENRRVAAPISQEIYLLREAACPAILAECGFLSNETEAALLREPVYQMRIALVLLCAYGQYLENE